jgi:hypothetical protein
MRQAGHSCAEPPRIAQLLHGLRSNGLCGRDDRNQLVVPTPVTTLNKLCLNALNPTCSTDIRRRTQASGGERREPLIGARRCQSRSARMCRTCAPAGSFD